MTFYLQDILDDINEQDTSFLNCKHKHMMKSGAPPEKFIVLCRMVTYRIPWFHKQNQFLGLSLFGSWFYLKFLEMVWVPLNLHAQTFNMYQQVLNSDTNCFQKEGVVGTYLEPLMLCMSTCII